MAPKSTSFRFEKKYPSRKKISRESAVARWASFSPRSRKNRSQHKTPDPHAFGCLATLQVCSFAGELSATITMSGQGSFRLNQEISTLVKHCSNRDLRDAWGNNKLRPVLRAFATAGSRENLEDEIARWDREGFDKWPSWFAAYTVGQRHVCSLLNHVRGRGVCDRQLSDRGCTYKHMCMICHGGHGAWSGDCEDLNHLVEGLRTLNLSYDDLWALGSELADQKAAPRAPPARVLPARPRTDFELRLEAAASRRPRPSSPSADPSGWPGLTPVANDGLPDQQEQPDETEHLGEPTIVQNSDDNGIGDASDDNGKDEDPDNNRVDSISSDDDFSDDDDFQDFTRKDTVKPLEVYQLDRDDFGEKLELQLDSEHLLAETKHTWVYRARVCNLGDYEDVAVKVWKVPQSEANRKLQLREWHKETKLIQRAGKNSAGVVRFHYRLKVQYPDTDLGDPYLVVVMELCNKNLRQFVAELPTMQLRGREYAERVRAVARQVLHAYKSTHDEDVMHRDVKVRSLFVFSRCSDELTLRPSSPTTCYSLGRRSWMLPTVPFRSSSCAILRIQSC
jgi:Protein kinase domain